MDEKIFFSDKEHKTIAELKAIGGINFPVFKDGKKMYKTSLDELLSASPNTVVLPYETATYAIINDLAQSGKQVIIYYMGVDDAQFWTLSHKNDEFSYVFTWLNGNSLVKMTLSSGSVWSKEVIDLKAIKDNARDDETDPMHPDNITDIKQLTFVRNVGADANYTMIESEERVYGVLIPHPSMEADRGKVPMYKDGNQIGWEPMPEENRIINVTKLAAEGATSWDPIIAVNEYTTLGNISSDMTSLVVSMDTLPDNDYYYEYKFKFTTPETLGITTFSVLDPSGSPVMWLGSAPSLTAGKTYEVSVVGNLAVFGESV